jgi:hypothetical protein
MDRTKKKEPHPFSLASQPAALMLVPFNYQLMEGLMQLVGKLLQDPQFCTGSVLVPFTCGTFGFSFACGFAVLVQLWHPL